MNRYRIRFPQDHSEHQEQGQVVFQVMENGHSTALRFHDYTEIYNRPGLYEQLFYDRLMCTSPTVVGDILKDSLDSVGSNFSERRVLDLGAGNGMMGEILKSYGVARLVGVDIIPEAKTACYRDRPHLYDDYYVVDFMNLADKEKEELEGWSFDCLTSVAALGFGDIPPQAFLQGLHFIKNGGWIAFNIKETFLDNSDRTGFSRFIRELIFSEYLNVHHLKRYRHRLSMEGTPLHYFALVAEKTGDIPPDFLEKHGI